MKYLKTYKKITESIDIKDSLKSNKNLFYQKIIEIIESLGFICRAYVQDPSDSGSFNGFVPDFIEFDDINNNFRFAFIIIMERDNFFLKIQKSSRHYDDEIVNVVNALPEYFKTINGVNEINDINIEDNNQIFFGSLIDSFENISKRLSIRDIKEKIEVFMSSKKYNL